MRRGSVEIAIESSIASRAEEPRRDDTPVALSILEEEDGQFLGSRIAAALAVVRMRRRPPAAWKWDSQGIARMRETPTLSLTWSILGNDRAKKAGG